MNINAKKAETIEAEGLEKIPIEVHVPDCPAWRQLAAGIPTLGEERWRVVDEGDQWVVWYVPQNHPERWRELATFSTETEAVDYLKFM